MKTLIVGGDAFLGKRLHERIGGEATSRRAGAKNYYSLGTSTPEALPKADVIYLVGGLTKFKQCEVDPISYHVNVDAQLEIAAFHKDAHIVYVSSETAEWPNQTAYGSQKRAAELGLLSVCGYQRLTVVRPGQIKPHTVDHLCALMEEVGIFKKAGLFRWCGDDMAQAKVAA